MLYLALFTLETARMGIEIKSNPEIRIVEADDCVQAEKKLLKYFEDKCVKYSVNYSVYDVSITELIR